MSQQMQYQVFISYRRSSGENLAQLLYFRLQQDGYNVFFDVESMRSGKFNEQIYHHISQCDDFLLVLSPNSLDRCNHIDDWVRLEIECALKNKKNIIPILGRDFVFPDNLPDSIENIRYYQGVTASSEFFDEVIRKIENMLVSNSNIYVPNYSRVKNQFKDLLKNTYQSMIDFRKAVQDAEINTINSSVELLQKNISEIFLYGERNQYDDKSNALIAMSIVDDYNKFVSFYSRFISFPAGDERMTPEAQYYALLAENAFNELLTKIIKCISELYETIE